MNVAAHQKKEKSQEMKTGTRKAGEERRQATDFKEAACFSSAIVQWGGARQKMVCARKVPGITGTLGKVNNHFHLTQTGSGTAPPR